MTAHHFVVFDLIDPAIGGTRMIFCDRCGIVRSARQENPKPAAPCIEDEDEPIFRIEQGMHVPQTDLTRYDVQMVLRDEDDAAGRYDLPSQMPDTDPPADSP
jgi:hypothetical protein